MRSAKTRVLCSLIAWQILLPAPIFADPFPLLDQKRPPLVLQAHGIFWAGGEIVNRTQSGTENSGDLKNLPYNQQQYLVGQAYVEYFIPEKLRNGRNTLPIVMVPGGALIGVNFLTTREEKSDEALVSESTMHLSGIVDVPSLPMS